MADADETANGVEAQLAALRPLIVAGQVPPPGLIVRLQARARAHAAATLSVEARLVLGCVAFMIALGAVGTTAGPLYVAAAAAAAAGYTSSLRAAPGRGGRPAAEASRRDRP